MGKKQKKEKRPQTEQEEKANAFTHLLGILFTVISFPFLFFHVAGEDNILCVIGVLLFGVGMLLAYASSTSYHYVTKQKLKTRFKIFDHISIFFLIGGSYSAVVPHYVDYDTTLIFMSVMWGIILLGSFLKLFFTGKYQWVSVILYLFLGWMLVFLVKPLSNTMPLTIFWWILAGGLCYTVGVIFYKNQKLQYSHAIWHLFVLAGTVFHYVAIYKSY